jgi:hypothetical protein
MTSRDDKPRGIDFEKMETALKEAAIRATYGSREDRSGRFLPVRSSVITSVEYDEDELALEITFASGKTYRYSNVPLEIYVGLLDAGSKGAYFHDNIRGAFAFAEIGGA